MQGREGICKKAGIPVHVLIFFFGILLFQGDQLLHICNSGQNTERILEGFAYGTFDSCIGDVFIAVSLEYIAETNNNASGWIGECIVKIE